jgi:hypothetical protein
MPRRKPRPDYRPYPEADGQRIGIKVSWRIYKDRGAAEQCAAAAKHNAVIQADMGYDFGYCMPGSIDKLEDERFEVCIP